MDSSEANNAIIGLCQKLEMDLEQAKAIYPLGDSVHRVVASLSAIKDFLREAGYATELSSPFQQLLHAFNDLSEGFTPPLFRAVEKGVLAKKRPSFQGDQWAVAAAAVTILKDDARWDLNTALRTAATAVEEKNISALREFRRNISRGRAPDQAVKTYRWCLDTFRAKEGFTPEQRARKLLEMTKAQKG